MTPLPLLQNDAPTRLTWTEQVDVRATTVSFSGPPAVGGPAWPIVLVFATGLGFIALVTLGRDGVESPIAYFVGPGLLLLGFVLMWSWRKGGPSQGTLRVDAARVVFPETDQPVTNVMDVVVRPHSHFARFQVIVLTRDDQGVVVAAFGDSASASDFAQRVLDLLERHRESDGKALPYR